MDAKYKGFTAYDIEVNSYTAVPPEGLQISILRQTCFWLINLHQCGLSNFSEGSYNKMYVTCNLYLVPCIERLCK